MLRYKLRTLLILLAVGPPMLAAPWLILAQIDGFLVWCLTVTLIAYWPWIVVAILLSAALAWLIHLAVRQAIRHRATLNRYRLHALLIILALLGYFAVAHLPIFDLLLWGFLFLIGGLIIGAHVILGIHGRQREN